MSKTDQQYQEIIKGCKELFMNKASDYGTSWSILRMPSVTDQILIKAERIRSIQESQVNKVGESIEGEFVAIVNYCIIALILLEINLQDEDARLAAIDSLKKVENLYDKKVDDAFKTMQKKNHDYGEAWRKIRVSSIVDLILMKIERLKQIEDNAGKVKVSEGADANYIDMLNYAVFSLIKMEEPA
ncbi:MAG: DUF1599 domain-containing protein [Bacteroidia bacterium]|nr:DUF1599 domain-containing protein [Bacteroidia bacterium]